MSTPAWVLSSSPRAKTIRSSTRLVMRSTSRTTSSAALRVFASVARVLRPGGLPVVALSHRCFPTKAVRVWQMLPPLERVGLVASYFRGAGGFAEPEILDRSPAGGDPLWIVAARTPV